MKRFMTLGIATIMVIILLTTTAIASTKAYPYQQISYPDEGDFDVFWGAPALRVIRPSVSLTETPEGKTVCTLHAGDEVFLVLKQGEYCYVEDAEGNYGYVKTAYLAYVTRMLWFENLVSLSPQKGMSKNEFASTAGGYRMSEMALVLYIDDDYYYVVTEDGYSGYVYMYDENIIPYSVHLELIQEPNEEVEESEIG